MVNDQTKIELDTPISCRPTQVSTRRVSPYLSRGCDRLVFLDRLQVIYFWYSATPLHQAILIDPAWTDSDLCSSIYCRWLAGSRDLPNPHRLRHKSQPRRHAPRTQHSTVLAQAPAAPAAPVIALGSAVPPAQIARIQENTKRVRFFLPVPAAPPREGVG